ncbi:MAG: hypothetical protein GYA45_00085 [Pelolinea sp.]|nr:hypothetical protein [Pelolinea sp.]
MAEANGKDQGFTAQDIRDLNVELKVGVLGTVTPQGLPHLTLLSSIQPCAPRMVTWGQFTEGLSKQYILENPKTGFLIMSLKKEVWRGKALYREKRKDGAEYENYNTMNMFRYNAYFGIHTVYYMDLVELHGRQSLPMGKVISAAVATMLARMLGKKDRQTEALNQWGQNLLNKVDNLKFLGYVDADGFPQILPVVQLQALDAGHLIFAPGAYGEEIKAIPQGAQVAMLGMSFDMEDVVTRGTYRGIQRVGGVRCGVLDVEWVYNAMPPAPRQIYPAVDLKGISF